MEEDDVILEKFDSPPMPDESVELDVLMLLLINELMLSGTES